MSRGGKYICFASARPVLLFIVAAKVVPSIRFRKPRVLSEVLVYLYLKPNPCFLFLLRSSHPSHTPHYTSIQNMDLCSKAQAYKAAFLKKLNNSKAEVKAAQTVVVKKKAAKSTQPTKKAAELVDKFGREGDDASSGALDAPAMSSDNEVQRGTAEKRSNEETTNKAAGNHAKIIFSTYRGLDNFSPRVVVVYAICVWPTDWMPDFGCCAQLFSSAQAYLPCR